MCRLCFTGGLKSMTRRKAEELARAAGHTVSHNVYKTTDYLVVAGGSIKGCSSKLARAKKMGVKEITEREFVAMV